MREAVFTKQNNKKWKAFEQKIAQKGNVHPDELADLFIEVTDDLAFSQTYYPKSKTTQYLNQLAVTVHQSIYKNKKEKKGRFVRFWLNEVPDAIYQARKPMFMALGVFLLSIIIGIISTLYDVDFPRYILGDGYVNKTLDNIENGNPMGIYGTYGEEDMFFMITVNNILVALRAIALGILLSFLTYNMMIINGVMVGVFFTFLYKEGVLATALNTVFIHGTIELSSIVIAGGAGIFLGNSILFPGTYSRMASLKKAGRLVAKIAIGLIPMFVIAGFLESFVTRHYQNVWVGYLSIGITLPFIIWYYILLPKKLNSSNGKTISDT